MSTIVIMPGGFHPFHAGHAALYQSAIKAFPGAEVFVAASNDTKTRPFPFAIKEKLAKLAGVKPGHFVQVKSPFQPKEITSNFNPEQDVVIFVRSEKDRNESPKPGGMKKDGTPAYFQPWTGKNVQPFGNHAYMAYLPTVEFGPGIKSATEIRNAWPKLDDRRKTAMVMSLYPVTQKNPKLAANVVKMLDMGMGNELDEDISRRGFLKGLGAAAVAGATSKAGAGQFTSSDDLNKDPESIEKVWKPRVAELQARCTGILNSFKSVASSVNPEWVPILDQVKLEITLGDTSLKRSPARAQGQTQTTTTGPVTWTDIKKQNPNEYSVDVWSKVYPNISYRGSDIPGLNPIIDIQTRADGTIVNTALRTPSKDPVWDQAVLGGISKTKKIPPRPGAQIIRINFPIRFWSATNKQPSVTKKSTYKVFIETTVFWDAPDSTLAWVLGHEIGHLVNNHPDGVSMAQRRQFELEADEVGAVLAQQIGYDRANFFQWLTNVKAENIKNSDPDPSHPSAIDRVNNLKQKTGFELATVKYIDSIIQQFQNGLAEAINKVEPISKSVPIQKTVIHPVKQHMHSPPEKKTTPAVVNHIKPREVKEFAPPSSDDGGGDNRSRRIRKLLEIAIQVAKQKNVDELGMIHAMNMIAGDEFFNTAVEGILPDITDKEYMFVLQSAYKTVKQGLAEAKKKRKKKSKNRSLGRYFFPGYSYYGGGGESGEGGGDGGGEGVNEFATPGSDDREPDEEEILRQLAAQWWNGTEQQMKKAQQTLQAMGWEIGQDESGDDDAGVFVIRIGDENGDSYIAFNHSDLSLDENMGLPYPATYEEENQIRKNGPMRITAMTSESNLSESLDYLEEK